LILVSLDRTGVTISISIKLFADDIKIHMEINTSSDVDVFQSGVDCIADWASKWQLKLASAKCQFFRVGLRKCSPVKYSLNGSDLPGTTATSNWIQVYYFRII